jgi:hypothetical protein
VEDRRLVRPRNDVVFSKEVGEDENVGEELRIAAGDPWGWKRGDMDRGWS